jgi:hypothetical protein
MTHCSAVGLKTAIVGNPEWRAVPASGEKARAEYHHAAEGNSPRADWTVGVWAKASPHRQWTTRQRRTSVPSGSAANALPPIGNLRSEAVNSGSPVGNLRHCLCNRCRPILGKSRLRNFFGHGNEVHAGGKVDDNTNLSHENPGPEETCGVGAIEKLAYDLWLARGCPVGCSEVDWFEAERQLNGTRESSGLSRPATQSQ